MKRSWSMRLTEPKVFVKSIGRSVVRYNPSWARVSSVSWSSGSRLSHGTLARWTPRTYGPTINVLSHLAACFPPKFQLPAIFGVGTIFSNVRFNGYNTAAF